MYAKRFRLDPQGNLHVDLLFCRVLATDPDLVQEASSLTTRHRLDNRAAKSQYIMDFEAAWEADDEVQALTLARMVHVVMLAQREVRERRKRQIAEEETGQGHTGPSLKKW
ncbi:hypothetical protein [Novilysobacter arseniciresistens]|uniref:hypothetical protein n=1 Tax=Novilysobacter arseniciresistens TaxID=1385522 RepID=UPI001269F3E9|nr:hypothetical protein [Lysobacter arseniciresistens]